MSTENKFKQYGVSGETAMLLDDRTFSISDCKEYVSKYGRYGDPEPIHTIEIAAVEQLKAEIQSWMKKVSEQEHTIVDWENYVAREKTENHKLKSKLKIAKETLTNLKSWGYQTQWEIIDKAISKIGGEI